MYLQYDVIELLKTRKGFMYFITARVRSTTGRYCFHKYVSVHTRGGGLPHLHPIILPLVPSPFWGYPSDWSQVPSWGYPSDWSQVPSEGYPGQVQMGDTQARSRQGGYHSQVWMGGIPARDGVPPIQGWGTTCPEIGCPQSGIGYAPG